MAEEDFSVIDTPAAESDIEPVSAQAGLDERKTAALQQRFRRQPKGEEALPRPASAEDFDLLAEGAEFIDPKGDRRVKPYRPLNAEDFAALPEGADFIDPNGDLRTTPRYEPVNATSQILYNMSVNDKERQKALERSYPGKVKVNEAGQIYVDDDGVMRKPKVGREVVGETVVGMAAPVAGGVIGEIGGALAGAAGTFGVGTLPGAIAGAGAGSAVGQFINDMVLQLAGVYDRSVGEQVKETALAAGFGAGGTAIGRVLAGAGPQIKGAAKEALPGAAAKFLGAEKEGLESAVRLAEQGVLVPPSGWAKEAPHIQNITEVFDPAFRTQKPLLQSATKHYEEQAGGLLETMGVTRPTEAGPLSKPTAEVSTLKAGEALKARALEESAIADGKLRAALDAKRAAVTAAAPDEAAIQAQMQGLQKAEVEARTAAQKLIDVGFQEIQGDITTAMKVAKAGGNSGDLWWSVGEKLKAVKQGIQERARGMYNQADELAGDIKPNSAGLSQVADDFLKQLPEGFEGKYPGIVKSLRDWAGRDAVVDDAGKVVSEAIPPVEPTFGQLHNLRSVLRQNYNSLDLTPDIKQGVFKFFANRVDDILKDPGADPALKAAAAALREADTFYRESMGPLTDRNIQAVMSGLESGLPADPKNLFDTLIKEGRSDLTRKVKELVGPNLWAGVKAADMQEMLDLSKTLVPDVIDGKRFAAQVLDRERHGMLEAVHGREATQKLVQQAQNIEMLAGRLPLEVRPGDTVTEVIARARAAAEAVKVEAKTDPLKVLNREMKGVIAEHAREAAAVKRAREQEPLGFLFKPTTGAAEAVDKILASEDLVLAAAARFGETSPEFNMLRQIYAQRILEDTLTPGKGLAKMTPELQQIIFPGGTLEQMQMLAKDMDFLMATRGVQQEAKSMAAVAKVEHPWGSIPLGKAFGKLVPGADAAGRKLLGDYYKLVTTVFSSPAFLRWVQKGLNGDEAAREMTRQQVQRLMQRGGAVGAGVGESQYQAPNDQSGASPDMPTAQPDRRSSLQDEGRVVSDATDYPVEGGQQYAADYSKQRPQVEGVPRSGGGGGGSGTGAPNLTPQERSVRLEQSLKSGDQFRSEFEQVKNLSSTELKALAKEFAGRTVTGREDALKKIWSRFQQLEQMRIKREFMAGRSAG